MLHELLTFVLATLVLAVIRVAWVLSRRRGTASTRSGSRPVRVMAVLGSGGHTKEMFGLLRALNTKNYRPFTFVVANTDDKSQHKLAEFRKDMGLSEEQTPVQLVTRNREVGGSFAAAVPKTIAGFVCSIWQVFKERPDLVLCNGPGTCLPTILAAFVIKVLGLKDVRIIFAESWCRTSTLSLTGKIVYPIVDRFIVQWPELIDKYPRAEHVGWLF